MECLPGVSTWGCLARGVSAGEGMCLPRGIYAGGCLLGVSAQVGGYLSPVPSAC